MKIKKFNLIFFFFIYSSNLNAEIFYIDIDKIINQTNVGKYINDEFKKLKKENDTKNLEIKNELKKREESLISQKNILDANEFNNKLKKFSQDVDNFNQLNNKTNRNLQNKLINNKSNFLKLIEPILLDYVDENNINYLLQKKHIIIGHNDLNKTNDIIELVNKKIDISKYNESISK